MILALRARLGYRPRNMQDKNENMTATTHFGFQDVPWSEKTARVRGVFDSVASRYDLMNDLMSAGVHRMWKSAFMDELKPTPRMRLLDVAGGTGDIAQRFLNLGGREVSVCDINEQMVSAGRDRAIDNAVLGGIQWTVGNAEALPFPDRSVDAYTIAFGLRNVTKIDAALAEARRVLRPGGHFLCLEFSHVTIPVLAKLYDAYSFTLIPKLGQWVTGDGDAYNYLVESIRRFPKQEELVQRLNQAGFRRARFQNMSGGIVAIHSAWRI